jgi:peptide/nickel transport system permease protein
MSDDASPDVPRIAPAVPLQQPVAIVVDEPAQEAAAAAAVVEVEEEALGGPPSALRLFLRSGSGRAGLVLFGAMLAVSIWVLLTYPSDFGASYWSNPTYWANNPRNAPPVWAGRFTGERALPQAVITVDRPATTSTIPAGEIRLFEAPYPYSAEAAPTSLLLTLTGVTYETRAPAILVSLNRPDGGVIRLGSIAVPGPRPGEAPPHRRFYEIPERVSLTDLAAAEESVSRFFAERYAGVPLPRNLHSALPAALFGIPAADGSGRIEPLPGEYRIAIQTVVANPADQIAPVEVTVGGTAFGLMGTDSLGRDLWRGLIYGFPVALLIAILTSLASTLVGASLGIWSGFAGGFTDSVIQRAADIVSNVPGLPLLIFIVSILGRHLWLIMLVLVAFSWPGLTILVRSMVLQIREGQLVESARALGASRGRIMARHVFPQVAPFIVAQMIFFAPGAILAEAGLSILGLGDPATPTWGQMLEAGFRTGAVYVGYWWWVLPPGILIVITALAFMLLALALEPIVDPRLRRPT